MMRSYHPDTWDVFISHATEDKEDVACPLAKSLQEMGLRVWFDEFTLEIGDSLSRSIDYGLANSKYGVIVIRSDFLTKEWTWKELAGFLVRESPSEKVILPIWHNIGQKDLPSVGRSHCRQLVYWHT